jgi:hypothetical protein
MPSPRLRSKNHASGVPMCIRVQFTSAHPLRPYDHRQRLILLPAAMPQQNALVAVRAVLAELAVVQPSTGARCFCGAPVWVTPPRSDQRRSEQVMSRGA